MWVVYLRPEASPRLHRALREMPRNLIRTEKTTNSQHVSPITKTTHTHTYIQYINAHIHLYTQLYIYIPYTVDTLGTNNYDSILLGFFNGMPLINRLYFKF